MSSSLPCTRTSITLFCTLSSFLYFVFIQSLAHPDILSPMFLVSLPTDLRLFNGLFLNRPCLHPYLALGLLLPSALLFVFIQSGTYLDILSLSYSRYLCALTFDPSPTPSMSSSPPCTWPYSSRLAPEPPPQALVLVSRMIVVSVFAWGRGSTGRGVLSCLPPPSWSRRKFFSLRTRRGEETKTGRGRSTSSLYLALRKGRREGGRKGEGAK